MRPILLVPTWEGFPHGYTLIIPQGKAFRSGTPCEVQKVDTLYRAMMRYLYSCSVKLEVQPRVPEKSAKTSSTCTLPILRPSSLNIIESFAALFCSMVAQRYILYGVRLYQCFFYASASAPVTTVLAAAVHSVQ